MITNKSLGLKGCPSKSQIIYFDGENKSIETDNFNALWELLSVVAFSGMGENNFYNWGNKNAFDKEESKQILEFLMKERLIVENQKIEKREERYLNYFGTYRNGIDIYKKLKHQKVLIIGTGTIGATLAYSLAKIGIARIVVIDNDGVEEHNIKSQIVFNDKHVCKSKVETLKEKIEGDIKDVTVSIYKQRINEINCNDIERIINNESIDFVFSCFDDSSYEIHNSIYQYCKNADIPYIISGYYNDSTVAVLLDDDKTKDKILGSYKTYDSKYAIACNKGTLIQSYISTLLNIYHLLMYLGIETSTDYSKSIAFNFLNMTIEKMSIQYKNRYDKLLLILNGVVNIEYLSDYVKNLDMQLKIKGTSDEIENRIVTLYKIFEILKLFPNEYDDLTEIHEYTIQLIDSLAVDCDYGLEEELEKDYYKIIQTLNINDKSLFKNLISINHIDGYEEKIKLQRNAYDIILSSSDEILKLLTKAKKHFINNEYMKLQYNEIYGINEDQVDLFDKNMMKFYEEITLKLYNYIMPGVQRFDYLYEIDEDEKIHKNIDEAFEYIKESIYSRYSNTIFGIDFISHVEHIKENSLFLNKEGNGVFTTHYFPEINESIIIFDHFDTLNSLYLMVHEIGHSFMNKQYSGDFYNRSQIIFNEILAHLIEVIFSSAVLTSSDLEEREKRVFRKEYLSRLNQSIISPYASYNIEKKVINHIKEYNQLSIDEYLEIRKYNLTPSIEYINQEYSKLNLLINPQFALEYKEMIIAPIAYLIAISIFEEYENNIDECMLRIKKYLTHSCSNIIEFVKTMFDVSYNDEFIEKCIKNFVNHFDKVAQL